MTQTFDTYINTHTWLQEHLDSYYLDLLKLKTHTNITSSVLPIYIEQSTQKLIVQCLVDINSKPISRYSLPYSQKMFAIFFIILEGVTTVHTNGGVVRGISTQNVLIGKNIQFIGYYIPIETLSIQVLCPLEFTGQKFNYSSYDDPKFDNFLKFRQYLAFPPDLRVIQKIRFTISCDIYQIGSLFYQICTGELPLDAFNINTLDQLQTQKLQTICILQNKNIPQLLIVQIVKLLYYQPSDYFMSVSQVHSSFNQIWSTLFDKPNTRPIYDYHIFKNKIDKHKLQIYNGLLKQVCDHFSGNLSFECLKINKFDSQQIIITDKQHKSIILPDATIIPSKYLNVNMGLDGNQYASDETGRLTIIQGYFGSGKSQLLLDVRQVLTQKLQSLCFYIPSKNDSLELISEILLSNYWTNKQIDVQNFYHFLLIYFSQGIIDLKNEILKQTFISLFKQQKEINIIFSLVPGFAKYLELGQPSIVQVAIDQIKDLLFIFIKQLLECSLMVIILLDDFQSNIHMNQIRVLLELLKKFPRLQIMTSEVPGLKLNSSMFCLQTENQLDQTYSTQKIMDQFQQFSEYIQSNEKDMYTLQQKQISQSYADIASIQSEVQSEASHISSSIDQQEIRTKCFAYAAAQNRGIKVAFLAINYMNNDQVQDYLKQVFNIDQPDLALTLMRKSFGSIKCIEKLLIKLYQHSAVLASGMIINKTLELLEMDDLYIAYQYVKLVSKDHLITKRDISVLATSTLLDPSFNSQHLSRLLEIQNEESMASCTNICTITHLINPSLPNCSLKNANYGLKGQFVQSNTYSCLETIYTWQNSLMRSIFKENFIQQYSLELYKCSKYMINKYYQQISLLEDRKSLLNFCFIQSIQSDSFQSYEAGILEDLQMVFNFSSQKIATNASILQLAFRQTDSKLLQELVTKKNRSIQQAVQNIPKQNIIYYFDGIYFPIDLLTQCLNSCSQIFTDIYDQIEIMKLNQYCVKQALFLGQIPYIYTNQVNESFSKLREINHFLKQQNITNYVDINGIQGFNIIKFDILIDIVQKSSQQSTFYQIYESIRTYELIQTYNSQTQYFNIILQRYNNYYLLNTIKFNEIQPLSIRLHLINTLFDQLTHSQNHQIACQLAINILQEVNYNKKSTVKNSLNDLSIRNTMLIQSIFTQQNYLDMLKQQLLFPISSIEYSLQYLIFKLISLFIFVNNPLLALNLSQSLVEKSIQSGQTSQFTLFCIHYVVISEIYITNNEQDSELDFILLSRQLCFDIASKIKNNHTFNLLQVNQLSFIEYTRSINKQIYANQVFMNLSNYFNQNINFSSEDLTTFSIYVLLLFISKQYSSLAQQTKNLLKNAIYVNLNSLSDFCLVVALSCKKIINNENYIIELPITLLNSDLMSIVAKICACQSCQNIQQLHDIQIGGLYYIDFIIESVKYEIVSQIDLVSIQYNDNFNQLQQQGDFMMNGENMQMRIARWKGVQLD
ncbi:hypothetical protein SS50377_22210 [Spironucleus salmonicida]|uniref:Uncharacterized protein n=1 Tax=Spironucleus salmonicida TaxID=348837 RepID=V6LN93_9EUKA|nr:hypothetical protein SS50377_22210 [Spironucleus salmonicida]|eukprot:EST46152.1 hypothetical protein SS50377_13744 [Spironucleus salmonicida]